MDTTQAAAEPQHRHPSMLQDAYHQEALAKKTVELSFEEENANLEKENVKMQIDAVLSDLSPPIEALLKACAKLTSYDGPTSQLDFDECIAKMTAEISELEAKNDITHDEHDVKQTLELEGLWSSLEKDQQLGAEDMWAENLMDTTHSTSEKSTFRDQFRDMMEDAVRRAVESERSFNQSMVVWERNFVNTLHSTTKRAEDDLRDANQKYYAERENMYNSYAESLRTEEGAWLSEIALEREYVRSKIDVVVDQTYGALASHCQTANRKFSGEYQSMLRDLGEYRAAYRKAKLELAKAPDSVKLSRQSSRRERSASPEKRSHADESPAAPNRTMSSEIDSTMQANLFFGKVPKKTMAFEAFTRIHEIELEAIGDPAQRHMALSKKLKSDYAVQSGVVLKSADAAMEDLRAMYFKRIIGMRDAFVTGHGGAPIVATTQAAVDDVLNTTLSM